MSAIEWTALIVALVWLGLLTLVAVLIVRQVALVSAQLEQLKLRSGQLLPSSILAMGPEVGERLPDSVLTAVPALAAPKVNVLLLSGSCASCPDDRPRLGNALVADEPCGTDTWRCEGHVRNDCCLPG